MIKVFIWSIPEQVMREFKFSHWHTMFDWLDGSLLNDKNVIIRAVDSRLLSEEHFYFSQEKYEDGTKEWIGSVASRVSK